VATDKEFILRPKQKKNPENLWNNFIFWLS